MRVATTTAYSQAVSSLNSQNYALNKTMLQISSGKRILVPSDDPAASARVLGLNQAKARTEQFQDNITALISALEVEETSLNSIVNSLQRIRELAVQANNDTYNASDRKDIAIEIQQGLETITSFANTSDGGGNFVFGGFDNRSIPFEVDVSGKIVSYTGDQGQQFLQIGSARQIASGDNGFDLFMNIKGSINDSNPADNIPMSVFDIVAELGIALETNTGAVAGEDFHDTVLRSISNLDKAIGHIVDAQATVGSRLNATDAQESSNEDYLIQVESTLSATQDLDYAEAISRLELEQAGLQASQQSFTKIQSLSLFDFI